MFKIEITADTANELGEKITALMAQFDTTIPDAPADKPATRRRAKPEPEAAEAPAGEKPALVADEGNGSAKQDTAAAGATSPSEATDAGQATASAGMTAQTAASPSEVTLDKDDVMAKAVKFSQDKGSDALETVLKQVGALNDKGEPRFSAMPATSYGTFVKALDDYGAGASALS